MKGRINVCLPQERFIFRLFLLPDMIMKAQVQEEVAYHPDNEQFLYKCAMPTEKSAMPTEKSRSNSIKAREGCTHSNTGSFYFLLATA